MSKENENSLISLDKISPVDMLENSLGRLERACDDCQIDRSDQARSKIDQINHYYAVDWGDFAAAAADLYQPAIKKYQALFDEKMKAEVAESIAAERVAKEKIKAEEVEAKRAADLENRVNIEVQVIDDIVMRLGLNSVESRNVISQAVEAIGSGDIPNIRITY